MNSLRSAVGCVGACVLMLSLATGMAWAEDAPVGAPVAASPVTPPRPPPPPPPAGEVALPVAPQPTVQAFAPLPPAEPTARLERRASGCCWPKDECGWKLGPCGEPIGRFSIFVEGAISVVDDIEGSLGEARANSLSWDGNSFNPRVGIRTTLAYAVGPDHRIEGRGVWYGHFTDSTEQSGVFGFSPPAGGTTNVTAATLDNSSNLRSFEGNVWHEFACRGSLRFSGALGARYLRLDETTSSLMQVGAAAPLVATVASDVKTDFIAGQIGLSTHWLASPKFEIGITAKALLGSMKRRIDVTDTNVFVGGAHSSTSKQTEFAWGGELEISLEHRLTRSFALTGSYALLFVNDVVRPNDAMNFSQANTGAVTAQQEKSDLLVHAFFVGFRLDL